MSVWNGLLAGIAGAVTVNVAHELTRNLISDAPRMDIVGMRALARGAHIAGQRPPDHLRAATFAGDLLANTLYYGLVGTAGAGSAVLTGGALGAVAGIGGVVLPPRLGLGDAEVRRTPQTQALTIGFYLLGGLVAGSAYRALASGRRLRPGRP